MEILTIPTTWGPIRLKLDGSRAVECSLPFLKHTPKKEFSLSAGTRPPFTVNFHGEPAAFKPCAVPGLSADPTRPFPPGNFFQWLENNCVAAPIKHLPGTRFQKAVWDALRKIPRGQTKTYGEIAAAIGRPKAARAVGSACGANPLPLFIPCHRAVAQNGLGGFGSGLPWKRLLLEMERSNKQTVES